MKKIKEDKEFEKEVLMDDNLEHYHINFKLPHEFGGCGAAYQQEIYGLFNIFTKDHDLAIIRPRWTTKQEFKVDLPQNSQLEAPEDQEMEPDGGQRLSMVKLPSIHSLEDKHEFVKNFE